jgi:hypothetical protein
MERLIVEEKNEKNNLPIEWAKNDADIMSLAGIWKNQPRTIEEIREKAWKRVSCPSRQGNSGGPGERPLPG